MKKKFVLGILILAAVIVIIFNVSNKDNSNFSMNGKIIDQGELKNDQTYEQISEKFNELYFTNLNEGKKTYLIYGDKKEIKILTYEDIPTGTIGAVLEKSQLNVDSTIKESAVQKIIPDSESFKINIGSKEQELDLSNGKTIYIIVEE